MNKAYTVLPKICIAIVVISLLAGFIVWLNLPYTVPVHFGPVSPDRYGSKIELLLIFIIPLFGLLRAKPKDYHYVDDEVKRRIEKDKQKAAFTQLFTALLCSGSFWFLMYLVIRNIP